MDNELSIEYKRLTENELDIFIEMRINQLREEGAKEDIDLKPALKDYYSRHMTEGTFVSWIAVDGNKIIGTSGMSLVAQAEKLDCYQVCLLNLITDGWELQKSFCTEL